ncbi:hypothetical protein [Terrimonas alba]
MSAIAVVYPNNRVFSAIIALLILLTWYFRPIQRFYFKILYP